jgi:hypothetical protein
MRLPEDDASERAPHTAPAQRTLSTEDVEPMTTTTPRRRAALALWLALGAAGAAALSGCAAVVHENHYFAAFKETPEGAREPVQFYRLAVDGNSQFSNTRYLTGYFDERAVSLFFNELKSPGKLFDDNVTLPGAPAGTKLTPLTPSPENGAFVLIMSTNADAIASTIGSFAESQAVADALTRIVNRDRIAAKARSDAQLPVHKAEGDALVQQLAAHSAAAASAAKGTEAAAAYRRALTAIARSLGYAGAEFASARAANDWFALEAAKGPAGAAR